MKNLLLAIRDAWRETRYRWSTYTYMTLDCRDGQHIACELCDCVCHDQGAPNASLGLPIDDARVIDWSA